MELLVLKWRRGLFYGNNCFVNETRGLISFVYGWCSSSVIRVLVVFMNDGKLYF